MSEEILIISAGCVLALCFIAEWIYRQGKLAGIEMIGKLYKEELKKRETEEAEKRAGVLDSCGDDHSAA